MRWKNKDVLVTGELVEPQNELAVVKGRLLNP